jgi:hypothetical protein
MSHSQFGVSETPNLELGTCAPERSSIVKRRPPVFTSLSQGTSACFSLVTWREKSTQVTRSPLSRQAREIVSRPRLYTHRAAPNSRARRRCCRGVGRAQNL